MLDYFCREVNCYVSTHIPMLAYNFIEIQILPKAQAYLILKNKQTNKNWNLMLRAI